MPISTVKAPTIVHRCDGREMERRFARDYDVELSWFELPPAEWGLDINDGEFFIPVKYCPHCGEKLEEPSMTHEGLAGPDRALYSADGELLEEPEAKPTPTPTGRPEYVKCIRSARVDRPAQAYCGRAIEAFDFAFLDADHAALNGMDKGRLVACPSCVRVIMNGLMNGQEPAVKT